jgi:hypothetical protein
MEFCALWRRCPLANTTGRAALGRDRDRCIHQPQFVPADLPKAIEWILKEVQR